MAYKIIFIQKLKWGEMFWQMMHIFKKKRKIFIHLVHLASLQRKDRRRKRKDKGRREDKKKGRKERKE
jgi:hypothetical protein